MELSFEFLNENALYFKKKAYDAYEEGNYIFVIYFLCTEIDFYIKDFRCNYYSILILSEPEVPCYFCNAMGLFSKSSGLNLFLGFVANIK